MEGRFFSPAATSNQPLQKTGDFLFLQHPLYTPIFFWALNENYNFIFF